MLIRVQVLDGTVGGMKFAVVQDTTSQNYPLGIECEESDTVWLDREAIAALGEWCDAALIQCERLSERS